MRLSFSIESRIKLNLDQRFLESRGQNGLNTAKMRTLLRAVKLMIFVTILFHSREKFDADFKQDNIFLIIFFQCAMTETGMRSLILQSF